MSSLPSDWGSKGREFESLHPDHSFSTIILKTSTLSATCKKLQNQLLLNLSFPLQFLADMVININNLKGRVKMKNNFLKSFFVAGLITLSVSTFAGNQRGNNPDLLFAKAQSIIENSSNISDLKSLSDAEKAYFMNIYVISLKSGEIVYSPSSTSNNTFISPEEGIVIVDKTVKAWQFDESKTVYDIGSYLTSVVVTNSRDVYILVIPKFIKA